MTAPHLPPKSCSRVLRERVRTLPALLIIILLSWLSGLSAALVALVWIVPQDSSVFVSSVYRSDASVHSTELLSLPDVSDRMLTLYDQRLFSDEASYASRARVGQAVVLSSDGWSVWYEPGYDDAQLSSFVGLDSRGQLYEPVSAVFDEQTGFVFIRWDGNDFRAVSFARGERVHDQDLFFPHGTLWKSTTLSLDEDRYGARYDSLSSLLQTPFVIVDDPDAAVSSVLVTSDGRFAGFVGDEQYFVSSHYVDLVLSQLLQGEAFVYRPLGVSGQFVDAVVVDGFTNRRVGFAVQKSLFSSVLDGDIIIEVDGIPLSSFHAADQLILSPEKHILTVIRSGSKQQVAVEPAELTL